MKLVRIAAIAATLIVPAFAAQAGDGKLSGPGQSEYAPGQRAQQPGAKDAKDYAPGQRMHTKDVKSQPGASEYAPGHLPNKDVKR